MDKKIILCLLLVLLPFVLYAETENTPPLKLIFHDVGLNALHSVTYNYGLNFIGAGLETWGVVENGLDFYWRNIAYNNTLLSNFGLSALYIGFAVPVITPVALYIAGQNSQDSKLQITALALTQSLMLTLAIQTPLKMITGRATPAIVNNPAHKRGLPEDDFSRTFNWFNMDFINGWPSGHTANAFSAAATIAEIYKDNIWLKVGVYSYAVSIGLGVSLNVHWASEVLAGALIGYAVGKTVGKSFRNLLENDENNNRLSFYFTPTTIGVIIKF